MSRTGFVTVQKPQQLEAGLDLPLVYRTQPPGCLILEDLQTPHPHQKMRFGHNTGYFFLSLVAISLLSRHF